MAVFSMWFRSSGTNSRMITGFEIVKEANVIRLVPDKFPDESNMKQFVFELSDELGISIGEIEDSADLSIASCHINEHLFFLKISWLTDDIWLELNQAVFDSSELKVLVNRLKQKML